MKTGFQSTFQTAIAVAQMEWRLEWRQGHQLASVALFAVASVYVAFQSSDHETSTGAWTAMLWLVYLFSGFTAIGRLFDRERTATRQYLRWTIEPLGLILGKLAHAILTTTGLTALVLGTLMLLFGSNAFAQHFSHTYRYTGDVEIDHIPDHDEILPQAPDNLILRFSAGVSLVKLVMKNAEGKVININFRYNPVANRVFIWPLPELPKSDYYVVDWGVIDPEQKLMSGQFLFSAGPDAVLPSSLVTEEDEEHIMVPDYRLIEPGSFLGPGQ